LKGAVVAKKMVFDGYNWGVTITEEGSSDFSCCSWLPEMATLLLAKFNKQPYFTIFYLG
jgi:hypothetical protein